jgi:regulatory protein
VPSGLAPGTRLEEAGWAALLDRAQYCQAFESCVRILARREHFPLELRRKLIARGVSRPHIEAALAACLERGYLDERRAAEQLVDTLASRGGIGRARFRAILLQRGCPRELAQEVLTARLAELDEGAETRALLARRTKSLSARLDALVTAAGADALHNARERRRIYSQLGSAVMRLLVSRGLTSASAQQAAAEFTRNLIEDA